MVVKKLDQAVTWIRMKLEVAIVFRKIRSRLSGQELRGVYWYRIDGVCLGVRASSIEGFFLVT
jgi:hypothetical protein